MRYRIKKIIFFLLAILCLPLLLYWVIFDLGECFDWILQLQESIGLRNLFRGDYDAIMGPYFYMIMLLPLTTAIYFIFYRKECGLWPKLLLLCAGFFHIVSALDIAQNAVSFGSYFLLGVYAAIALAAAVWLIAAMVKYPKPVSRLG